MANETKLNMQLLLRRDDKFVESYKLAAGEPGFEISTNTLKIGDGVKTWAELPIANKGLLDNSYKTLQEVIAKVETDANVFVDTIAQNANGEISITTKAVDFSAADNRFKKLQTVVNAVATEKNTFIDTIAQDAQGVITITTKAVDFGAYRTSEGQDVIDNAIKGRLDALEAIDHSHTFNEAELNKIAVGDVDKWNAAEQNAKDYVDGLNTSMNTRVEALEAIDHSHDNKALLDTYTQTEANLADAVAKRHEHANKTELDKIVAGDVAKWDNVAADYLKSTDKKALEDSIGDVNTALENYKTSNNEALAGVKATAEAAATKTYTDTELAKKVNVTDYNNDKATFATKTELNNVDAKFASYKTAADQKLIDDAQDVEIGKKVDKVEGKSLIADTEIARLATLANYDDTQVKADIAKKADAETMTTELGKKVDKVEGYSLVSDAEIARLKDVDNYDDTALAGRVTAAEGKITALESASATHALKSELEAVDKKFADYNTTVAQKAIDDAQDERIKAIEDDYVVANDIANFETKANVKKVADDLAAYVESNDAAVALKADKSVVEAMYTNDQIDGFVNAKVNKTDYEADKATFALKSEITSLAGKADKTYVDEELGKKVNVSDYNTEKATFALKTDLEAYRTSADQDVLDKKVDDRIKVLEAIDHTKLAEDASAAAVATVLDGAPEKFDTLKEIAAWIAEADTAEDAASLVTRVAALEAIDHDAYADADAELKEELEGKINAINNHSHTFVESELNEIKAGDVAKWNNEIGAKELAASKTTTAEVKTQIEAYGYATTGELATEKSEREAADAELSAAIEAAKTEAANQDAVVLAEAQAYADQVAAAVDTGVMEVEAGNDIEVTTGENGKVTVAHAEFTTGAYAKNPADSDKTGDVYLMTGVTVDNGHVTGANVQSLAAALMGMTFIIDGGNSNV